MAQGQITRDQIAEKNTFGNITDSAKMADTAVKSLGVTINAIVEAAKKLKSGISSEDPKNNQTIKERNDLLKASNLLVNSRIEAEKLLKKQTEALAKESEKNLRIEKELAKQLTELELKTNKLTAARNDLLKKQKQADAQRKAGNEEIAEQIDLTEEEKDTLVELTQQLTLANLEKSKARKLNKEQVADLAGLTDEYQKQSKRLNTLRKEFKSLLLQEGKATKETKRLEREITDLDRALKDVDEAAGQFQRNVGNYPDTLGKAAKSLALIAAGAISVKGAFDGVSTSLNENAEGSENVREVTAKLGGAFDQVKNVVASAALDLFDYGKGLKEVFTGEATGFAALGRLRGGFRRTSEATEDFTEKLEETANAQAELEKRVIDFEKSSRPLEVRLSRLNGLIEQQSIIAGDSTRSFNEISDAILKGQDLQVKRANINVSLAKEELEITRERVRIANLAGGASVELLDQETEAIKKLIDAENELKNEVKQGEKELRQVKQDRREIDLDILIDGFDNQKTINERIIDNEKETLERRRSLFEETSRLANESFEGQKDVLEDLSKAGIDVDELLGLDATELAKQIQLLEQSEIINTRTLEVIRERRLVLQDLDDKQKDLNASEQDSLDLRAEINAQEDALYKLITGDAKEGNAALQELEEQRAINNIENLERRLALEKDGSVAYLQIQKELNDALLDEQEKFLKEQEKEDAKAEKKRKEELKKRTEDNEKAIKFTEAVVVKSIDARIDKLNEEQNAREKNLDEFRQAARDGNITAKESLAEEQILADEAQAKAEKRERDKQNFLLVTSVLSAFNSELGAGKTTGQALASAVTSTAALQQFASALPAFLDGVEDTGSHGQGIDGKGGFHAIMHPNEGVLKKELNQKKLRAGLTNEELVDNAINYSALMEQKRLGNLMGDTQLIAMANGVDLSGMEAKLTNIEKAINDKPVNNIALGEITQSIFEIIEETKKGNTTTINKYRTRR